MDIIYTLIPGMMFFGVLLVIVLVWAVKKGQYEDMEGSANSILLDDDDDMLRGDKPKENASTDKK
jgi:cbb3-type cytochrome oxidase maturation protein